ncbi:sigma-70 family RNA polymerase sigma factor [Rhodosalinus sediminis]|nr:FliA/WhiG family RNA polymerase sigma factor [Rhodosalinus sediminis]
MAHMLGLKTYRDTQEAAADRRIEENMDMVRRLAWHYFGRAGRFVEVEDLLQAGYYGLVDASRRYTEQEGVPFASYAAIRVRGAIVDVLRRNSNLCRATISMQSRIRDAETRLSQRLQRAPETEDLAAELEMSPQDLAAWRARLQAGQTSSLDEVYSDHSLLFEGHDPTPEDQTYAAERRAILFRAIGRLPDREALVLQLYYVEELNGYEVAEILGVTTGRVSQLKKAALERVRALMAAEDAL